MRNHEIADKKLDFLAVAIAPAVSSPPLILTEVVLVIQCCAPMALVGVLGIKVESLSSLAVFDSITRSRPLMETPCLVHLTFIPTVHIQVSKTALSVRGFSCAN
ncbi:MAG TPA: hypothetical protein VGJ15_09085 [Pirellulales bacterium]